MWISLIFRDALKKYVKCETVRLFHILSKVSALSPAHFKGSLQNPLCAFSFASAETLPAIKVLKLSEHF